MAQASWPIVGQNFSDVDWRDLFGTESGVIGDRDGSAYKITLPTDSDIAQVGSTTQASTAQVAGFGHRILAGQTEPVTIPAATGTARTDIVALRYDPSFTGLPGPVRLVRIAGTSSGLPVYDDAPPGIEDLPLHSITRQPGQALSQALVRPLYTRLSPVITLTEGAPLPLSSPLDSVVYQGAAEYRRVLNSSGNPAWLPPKPSAPTLLRDVGRQANHLTTGGGSQPFGSATSGRLVIPDASTDRAVRIDCHIEVYCPSTAATAGIARLYSNSTELLPNPADQGTFHNRTGVGYGPRPANMHLHWEGVLSSARQNIWVNVTRELNSQEFWITGFDLTVVYR